MKHSIESEGRLPDAVKSRRDDRQAVIGIALVVVLVLLVALAVGAQHAGLVLLLLVAVAGSMASVRTAFPGVPMLWITFGICTPLYSAIYATSLATMFYGAAPLAIHAAYLLPLVAFVGALFWRRAAIASRLATIRPGRRPDLIGGLVWLALSVVLGASVRFALPHERGPEVASTALLGTMAALAVLVVVFVADIAALLTETGLLFLAFASRMAKRVVPIFSFVIVFTFVVVVFATLYAVLDRFSGTPNFSVGGEAHAIDFAQALYFSFVTLSTIGYGDITPVTNPARLIVVAEIIFGVVLMLFAFSEIAAYDPQAHEQDKEGN